MNAKTASSPAVQPGKYLILTLGKKLYAVPVLSIREILRMTGLALVPNDVNSKATVQGVSWNINLRGKIVPVNDLRSCIGKVDHPTGDEHICVVVFYLGSSSSSMALFGSIVDDVHEVKAITAEDLETFETLNPVTEHLIGVIQLNGSSCYFIDLQSLLVET